MMSNWFVFCVQSGSEHTACGLINKLIDRTESVAFVPQVEMIFKNSKIVKKQLRPMFPGYIFAESSLDGRSFVTDVSKIIRYSERIFYLLGKADFTYASIYEEEKNNLLGFYNNDYVVQESKGFINGDKVFVTSGPLKGRESIIKRINRHKRVAEVEMEFMGEMRITKLSLEIIHKI